MDISYGYTLMGAKWTFKTPLNAPSEFVLEYPEKQRLHQWKYTLVEKSFFNIFQDFTQQ